ncbi:MAG: UTP--glucose-1-phosphate uridylyltransferase GalU [Gammaproteobacteria bacterium]|nr:UTP--glucose-1-phosphate uridylyltransferase GalU [Gammaproteobacteria bacterium]
MATRIRKAVFPVAGLGTRFLPATKAVPKETLPIVDKPLIQYAVEEAVAAGIDQLIFITGRNKRSIPDHFDMAYELEAELEASGKTEQLEQVRKITPEGISCVYLRQRQALGLGHAVLCAEPVVGDEPFAVILADDLIDGGDNPCLKQMIDVFQAFEAGVIAVEQVPPERISRYGVISGDSCGDRLWMLTGIVEKPPADEAPSDLGVVGRYILTPEIFDHLRETAAGAGGEIQLTDAIALQLQKETVQAYQFEGKRYDCGSKLGYLQASVEYALNREDLGEEFRAWLEQL